MHKLRDKFYRNIAPEIWDQPGLSPLNRLVMSIVLLSITLVVLESEPEIRKHFQPAFEWLNVAIVSFFSIEYIIRLWAIGSSSEYRGWSGLVRYILTPVALVDLFTTAILWADVVYQIEGAYAIVLRLIRVLRLFMLARSSKWAVAIGLLGRAMAERKRELIVSLILAGIILLTAATALFMIEGKVQPDAFGSIPRALWWAVATLTTIGYGDVYPITALGKICAGIVAITSIALIALPTGIMAAAFSDVFKDLKDDR